MPIGAMPPGGSREPVVLVVEDEFLIAMELDLLLTQAGWRVLGPAATVEAALELLNKEQPDVAALDVNLRGRLIIPVATALRTMGVPFVVTSAYRRADLPGADILAEAPFVAKPIVERPLLAALAQLKRGS